MALKLLNPGLRPLGMFDLEDDTLGTLEGGEHVELNSTAVGAEGYAADVADVGPFVGADLAGNRASVKFDVGTRTAGSMSGLADEGSTGYGTMFGRTIGSNAGRATVINGAVVVGPTTERASGKVTVWSQSGLYAVDGAAATDSAAPLSGMGGALQPVNSPIHADAAGLLGTNALGGQPVAIFVGHLTDTSLVSTTNTAVGIAKAIEASALYLLDPR
jgi:hypothetical protein